MSLSAGMRLGPYEILGPLGAGGMGEVYRARDSRLNREVAIKTLPAAFCDDAHRLARLEREAQLLASLNHPNIAAVYGLEEGSGVRALVMELVEGPTLAERIAGRPVPVDEALEIARQIADALEAAHRRGIIHRDLKPANVKLTGTPAKVKLLDFGLAKDVERDSAATSQNSPTLTLASAGVILGTAAYMSPEQARGRPLDQRTDIWSFGVVLYEMLTGSLAFPGETVSDTLAAVLRAEPGWNQLPAGTPPAVRRLLRRCLQRDPQKRLRDIGDARLELDADEDPVAPPPALAPPRRAWLPWAAGILIGAAAALGWNLWHIPPAPPRPVIRWSYTQKDFFAWPALSHDGTRLAFAESDGARPRIVLRTMDRTEVTPVPGAEGGVTPTFSPDGQWLAFIAQPDGQVKKISVAGGLPISLAAKATQNGSDWSQNGDIVFSASSGIMKVPAAGGPAQAITTVDGTKGEAAHLDPHFLPGGQALLFTIAGAGSPQVAVVDLEKRVPHPLLKDASSGRYVPTGHLVYLRGNTLYAAPFNLRRMELSGPEAIVTDTVESVGPVAQYSFCDSGLLVYVKGAGALDKTVLAWADRQGALQPLTQPDHWGTGRLSPDGSRIATSLHVSPRTEDDIWIYDTDRRSGTRLTSEGSNQNPIWTPDGRGVTFQAIVAGKAGLYSVPADGSAKPQMLFETEGDARPDSWSPDGKALVYSMAGKDQPRQLWVLPAGQAAAQPYRLHDASSFEDEGAVSPDGHWLAYTSAESGPQAVYAQPFPGPGGRIRISTEGGRSPRWSKNGRQLYYRDGARILSVEVQTAPQFHAGIPTLVFTRPGGTTWDLAPDGKRFLFEEIPIVAPGSVQMVGVVNWFEELRRLVPAGR